MTEVEFQDTLELLLGDCNPGRMASARRVTTAIRLLLANTREGRSPSAAVRSDSARDELQSHRRRRLGDRLSDLLAHLSRAHARGPSFLRFPAPKASYTDTWAALLKVLDEKGRARIGLEVPVPAASDGAPDLERILHAHGEYAAAVPGGIEELRHLHWRARVTWILDGAHGPFLESLRRIAERARPRGDGEARLLLDGILGDTMALHLDCGALVQAMEIVRALGWDKGPKPRTSSAAPSPLRLGEDGRARAYAAMASWFDGATDVIPGWVSDSDPFGGEVPERWTRIVESVGAVKAIPGGGFGVEGSNLDVGSTEIPRRDLSARAMIVRVFDGARGLRVVRADVAPALRDQVKAWERSRQFAASEPGTPEHVMVGAGRRACAIVQRSTGRLCSGVGAGPGVDSGPGPAGESRGAPGPMAVICEPLFDRSSELIGCLWLEFDHRLLPCDRDVHAAARLAERGLTSASPRVAADASSGAPSVGPFGGSSHGHLPGARAEPSPGDCLGYLRSAWAELMDGVLVKTQERRWGAFHWRHVETGPSGSDEAVWGGRGAEPKDVVCVAAGGDGDLGEWTGGAESILRRSMTAAATIRYGRSEHGTMSFHGGVQGASIPLLSGGMVIGALVVESSRRGDLSEDDISRWSAALNQSVGRLELALIHGRDSGQRGGGGFALDGAAPDAKAWLARIRTLSRAHSDVLILGEPGSGRRTVARAIHHAGSFLSRPGPLVTVQAFGVSAIDLQARLSSALSGSLVLSGIECLDHAAQGVLANWLAIPRSERARLLATAAGGDAAEHSHGARAQGEGLASKGRSGAVHGSEREGEWGASLQLEHRELSTLLMRAVLRVEPLRHRRHWVPSMAKSMLARIAAREGGEAVELDDEAAALLWRQPWPGNAHDLDALLYGTYLAQRERGEHRLDAPALALAFQRLGASATGRLASRDPSRRDLAAAAWTTRTASGRINKTRAALYLGWDPATVATRIREAELDGLEAVGEALLGSLGARAERRT